MANRLKGKVAFICGAGSIGEGWGNGKATAVLYAREGASVFAIDVNLAAAQETQRIIEAEGGTCAAHQADLRKAAGIKGAVDACLKAFGRIDILQNNVGASARGGTVEMTEEVWDQQFDLNLRTAFLACKHVCPVMEKQGGGAIVNIASIAGIRYIGRDLVGYAASKAALIQMSRSVAMQYVRKNIRSNCVLPGLMNTPLISWRAKQQYGDNRVADIIAVRDAMCPSGKMGDAWDVAYASLYLASDEAKYVTATELVVDGGMTQGAAGPQDS